MVRESTYAMSKKSRDSRLGQLLKWIDLNADAMLSDPEKGLEAVGVGRKNADRLDTSAAEWCIVGFVKAKLTERELERRGVTSFSAAASFASTAATELTEPANEEIDVVEVGSAFTTFPGLNVPVAQRGVHGGLPPMTNFQKPFDIVRAGLGITNPVGSYPQGLSVGTLGFFVRDGNDQAYLVSNNHVIGRENNAQLGNAIVQPGTLDLTQTELGLLNTLDKLRNRFQIAKVSTVVEIQFGATDINEVDVAMALLEDDVDQSQIARIGFGSFARGVANPYNVDAEGNVVGETRVYKAGRTTGWTEGLVSQIAVASNVKYSGGIARFRNQLAITPTDDNDGPFSRPGDSGSGIWNVNNELVGLLFAGSTLRTLANPIGVVLEELEKELGTGSLTLVAG